MPSFFISLTMRARLRWLSMICVGCQPTPRPGGGAPGASAPRPTATQSPAAGNNAQVSRLTGDDPVNAANGEFLYSATDLAFPGFGVGFEHVRTYRSRLDYRGHLGHGWDHSYNRFLFPSTQSGCNDLNYAGGDGTVITFRHLGPENGTIRYSPPAGIHLELVGNADGSGWELRWPSGVRARFDTRKVMVRLEDRNGTGLGLTWEPDPMDPSRHRLVEVADALPTPRRIRYSYDGAGFLIGVREATSGLGAAYT